MAAPAAFDTGADLISGYRAPMKPIEVFGGKIWFASGAGRFELTPSVARGTADGR